MAGKNMQIPLRYIVFNIHPVSARLRFLRSEDQHVCLPAPLPLQSEIMPNAPINHKLSILPNQYLNLCREQYKLALKQVKIVNGFRAWINTPEEPLPVYALQFNDLNCCPQGQCKWIDLLDAFSVPRLERELMHAVYCWLLED